MKSNKQIDIIVPCYNEGEVLGIYFDETFKVIEKIEDYEFKFILIDDGSTDNTLDLLKLYSEEYSNIEYISFSRNFGKESAMYAGIKNSTGDFILIMDSDLQNPPNLIPRMIEVVDKEGFDCCSANRTRKGDAPIRTYLSRKFYKIIDKISEVDMPDGAGDFRMMSRAMVEAIIAMGEVQRFSKGIFSWVGFKTKNIYFENVERAAGETKWSFGKLFLYALDGITAFSTFPLKIVSYIGAFISSVSFFYLMYIILKTMVFGIEVPGYASMITIQLLLGGAMILACGILGEYISKIYLEVKNRPIYIIRDTNLKKPENDYRK